MSSFLSQKQNRDDFDGSEACQFQLQYKHRYFVLEQLKTKGVIITGIILAAITIASFSVWLIPQSIPTRFLVSNAQEDLDGLLEQQKTILEYTGEEFENMINGGITADDYINIAEISHSQINSLIIKVIDSEVPSEWNDSYVALLESLRSHNSYLMETIVVAKKLKDDPQADVSSEMSKIGQYLRQADDYLAQSDSARP
jgi:lipopolysaccharide export LptBFGC system permease protein LptF